MPTIKALNSEQRVTLQALVDAKNYPDAYLFVHSIIETDENRDIKKVANWLEVAAHINADDGTGYSDYVRSATIRAGLNQGTPITNEQFQHASDQLAESVLNGILSRGGIPDIDTIVAQDVKSAVIGLGLNMEGWAGTSGAVFPTWFGGLGLELDDEFYQTLFQDFQSRGIDTWYEYAQVVATIADNSVAGILDATGAKKAYTNVVNLFDSFALSPKPQIWRDPNIITFDRLKYDFQAPGPYVAVKGHGVDDRFEIQTFHRMISMGVSVITAAASRIGETPVEFYLPPRGVECSTERNDVIRGSDVSPTVIYGGPDTGNAQIFVQGEAALLESDADRSPSFGYYVSSGTAPVAGDNDNNVNGDMSLAA